MFCVDCGHKSKYEECTMCHRIRNGMNRTVFYAICERICEAYPTKRKRKILTRRVVGHPFCRDNCVATENSYYEFMRQSKRLRITKKLKEPLLSKGEFEKIISRPCIYCGVDVAGGVDRIKSSLGYVHGNCLSSCSQCNYMKKNIELDKFINKIYDICDYRPP